MILIIFIYFIKMLWDNLPDDIQEIVYKKIVYKQPKILQNDIISYINTMNEIEYCIYNQEHDSNWDIDWNILWLLVLLYYNKDNYEREKYYNDMKDYILNNNNLIIRYEGAMYWIKRFVKKISIDERKHFINFINKT